MTDDRERLNAQLAALLELIVDRCEAAAIAVDLDDTARLARVLREQGGTPDELEQIGRLVFMLAVIDRMARKRV